MLPPLTTALQLIAVAKDGKEDDDLRPHPPQCPAGDRHGLPGHGRGGADRGDVSIIGRIGDGDGPV